MTLIIHSGMQPKIKITNTTHPTNRKGNADQTWVRSDKEKANNFVAHLEKVFTPNEMSHNEEFEKESNRTLEKPLQITTQIKFFTPKEIQKILKKILPQGKPQNISCLQREY
jgi:hypothetical protein